MKIEIHEGFEGTEVIIKCPKITEEVRKIEVLLNALGQRLICTKESVTYFISWQDILYFESVDKRCFLYTAMDIYETNLRLYEIEELLTHVGFIRSSKSQVLNIAKIKTLCPDFGGKIEALMNNGEKLIISRQYAKTLKERLGLK